jgi:hypothetical protein
MTNKELADLLDGVASVLQLESFYDLASESKRAAQQLRESREWVKVTDRLPTEEDGDCHGYVWTWRPDFICVLRPVKDVRTSLCTHWCKTNLVRPEKPQTMKEG